MPLMLMSQLTLGPITFLAPLALLGLLLLPLIWWILRITPPQPKKAEFPPLRILAEVTTEEETPDSTPLWLLLFRLFLAALLAFALAQPIVGGKADKTDHPLVLIVDDGWDAAANWTSVIKEAEARIVKARRANTDVLLMNTTQPSTDTGFVPAQEALIRIKGLSPKALFPTRHETAEALKAFDISGSEAIWLSSGMDFGHSQQLGAVLSKAKRAKHLAPLSTERVIIPGEVSETADGFRSEWINPSKSLRQAEITAHDRSGSIVARGDINFGIGDKSAEVEFDLPADLRNKVAALRIAGKTSAGSVKLLDDSWGRPVIGILTPAKDNASPLLSEPFYAEKALSPYADIFTGTLDILLPLAPSIIIMPDAARLENEALTDFVETGGLLIRFAGSKLAERSDGLLPVLLREGDRALGGALTWDDPQTLDSFPQNSPFFGLSIPNDIFVKQQVMAEPGAQTDAATWARLKDGAPIVTSSAKGLGRIVLFHVTAGPEWSNLAIGGLYVNMLRRLLPLANNRPSPNIDSDGDWAPDRVLTGFGRLVAAAQTAGRLPDESFENAPISLQHPAGLYKQGVRRKARNIVNDAESIGVIEPMSGVAEVSYSGKAERTLGGVLLSLALIMFALDVVFSLISSGRLGYLRPGAANSVLAIILSCCLISPIADAQTSPNEDTASSVSDALSLHLAYVKTGNADIDDLSKAGLETLVIALSQRTTIEPAGIRGVNPETDPLIFYPFLYYPVERSAQALSQKASEALNAYMASGGTIVFDTRDQGDRALLGNTVHPGLAAISASLDIPQIAPIPDDHVMSKSFYLLENYPGRWADGTVWVDKDRNGTARDGVSSVIIGANDWAAAWAIDDSGQGLITLERDMPRQREFAMRFGVNLTMYVLSGNYKSDQVHAAALIERIGTREKLPQNLGRALPEPKREAE